jgi:hypothetical protein
MGLTASAVVSPAPLKSAAFADHPPGRSESRRRVSGWPAPPSPACAASKLARISRGREPWLALGAGRRAWAQAASPSTSDQVVPSAPFDSRSRPEKEGVAGTGDLDAQPQDLARLPAEELHTHDVPGLAGQPRKSRPNAER